MALNLVGTSGNATIDADTGISGFTIDFDVWTTATRPATPSTGDTGFNSDLNCLETYNGSAWVSQLPSQTGNSGKYLTTDGTSPSWGTISATTPAGSTGQVQYNNAGAFGAISSGTSGQVLTSQGSGSAPTWATASGGSWIYLSTVTASNSATVDIETTFNSTYDTYYIVVSKFVPQTSGESLYCRLKVDGSYDTSSYRYHAILNDDSETSYNYTKSQNASWIRILPALGNSTGQNAEFVARVTQPAITTNTKMITYQGSYVDSVNVRASFTAQDTSEANYLLAVIHFFRSVTKMFYGQDAQRGAPPPLTYLSGLGDFQFNEHPCVISQFNYSLPADVDDPG